MKYTQNYKSFFSENINDYNEQIRLEGLLAFENRISEGKTNILQTLNTENFIISSEFSPYYNRKLESQYLSMPVNLIIDNSIASFNELDKISIESRYSILEKSLKNVENRFFELAYATMHTTGQSFLMSFQASGPHACDRVMETIMIANDELTKYPSKVNWQKDLGKFNLIIDKDYRTISKGIGLVIGCSTFPTWNSVTGIYANLMCGNPVIVKPHPLSIYPIAIFVEEIRHAFKLAGYNPDIIQMAVDFIDKPITNELVSHEAIKLIDFTGNSKFGELLEGLKNKEVFTEKAGVNSCIVDSTDDVQKLCNNLTFSVSLYSGQMCTAPQNIFVPESGINSGEDSFSFDEFCDLFTTSLNNLVNHPKAGPNTLGALQNTNTLERLMKLNTHKNAILKSVRIVNSEFPESSTYSPLVIVLDEADFESYKEENFGPIVFIVKTKNTKSSINIAKEIAINKGSITCLCYCVNDKMIDYIRSEMNSVYVPVSFNFKGAGFVNQHAAFSDMHVTGGNPSGNATFTDSSYINRRFIWVGNRYM